MMTPIGLRFWSMLSPKEKRILPWVAQGMGNKDIGAAVGIGEQVVKNYLRTSYAKAGMESRVEFVVFLFRHGVVACPCGRGEAL